MLQGISNPDYACSLNLFLESGRYLANLQKPNVILYFSISQMDKYRLLIIKELRPYEISWV